MQVLIVEEEGGVGTLCIRSPGMFREYWNLSQVHKHTMEVRLKFNILNCYVTIFIIPVDVTNVGGLILAGDCEFFQKRWLFRNWGHGY